MSSKLPKPLGIKLPQIRSNQPLAPINENVFLKSSVYNSRRIQEAPVASTSSNIVRSGLRRKSKSVSDLTSIKDKPAPNFRNWKLPLKPSDSTAKQTLTNSKVHTKAAVSSSAHKRTLDIKKDDTAPKPKMAKKLPDWDYKGRFQQLNEKHQKQTQTLKDMEAKLQEVAHLIQDNANLHEKYNILQAEYTSLIDNHRQLEAENLKNSQDANNYKTAFDSLTDKHRTTSQELEEMRVTHQELMSKSNTFQMQIENLSDLLTDKEKEIRELKERNAVLQDDVLKFASERRVLHNTIQDLKGNIRVYCRVRPPLFSEKDRLECSIHFLDDNGLEIRKSRESISDISGKLQDCRSEFTFDKVFPPNSNQEEIFEDLAQLVQSALDGYNICVFAYGQTGSGKTYTMQGGEGTTRGMVPRTIELIFQSIENLKRMGWTYTIHASFLEIYNENLRDLLNLKGGQKLEIYFNEGKGITVNNLTVQYIESAIELENHMRVAQKNRATAATNFNEHSSRSHLVTKIYLQGTLQDQNTVLTGSINLVDLAGSENAKQSSIGDRLTETKSINKSLATLGDVMCSLYKKTKHVPYRNSKLTSLLQSCLGGNSKTLMIVNIAPFEDFFMESLNALRFAAKVKEVKTGSRRNKMVIPPSSQSFVKQKTTLS